MLTLLTLIHYDINTIKTTDKNSTHFIENIIIYFTSSKIDFFLKNGACVFQAQ